MLLAAAALLATSQPQDSVRVDTLAPGVVHHTIVRPSMGATAGPWRVHVLEVDLHRRDVGVETAHAPLGTTLVGRRRPSEIVRAVDSAWCRQGRRVRIARPPEGMDFNDLLMTSSDRPLEVVR